MSPEPEAEEGPSDAINALERQAEDLIDENRIDEALALCHRIVSEHGPTFISLDYIQLCEWLQQLARIRRVVEQHPRDFVVAMAEIAILRSTGRHSHVCHRCTIQLESETWDERQRVEFRSERLEAAIKGGRPDHFFDDLTVIWEARLGTQNDRVILKQFARMIVQIHRPSFVEPLRHLADKFVGFEKLTRIIHLKIQELELLGEITAEAGSWQR